MDNQFMLIYFLQDFTLCQTGLRRIIYKDCYNWDCELVSQLPMPKEKKHCKTNNPTVFSAFFDIPQLCIISQRASFQLTACCLASTNLL